MPREITTEWQLLRVKLDETADDEDWIGLNDDPADDADLAGADAPKSLPSVSGHGHPLTGIEAVVIGVTAAGVPVDRGTGEVDMQLVTTFPRDNPNTGGDVTWTARAVVGHAVIANVPLQQIQPFQVNGARDFTIRIVGDSNLDAAVNRLQIWYRGVYRTVQ